MDYGILEATEGSIRLITPKFKGTLLGGGILVLLSSLYYGFLIIPFIYLHVSPITQWDPLLRALFVIAIPAWFLSIIFVGLGWVRRVQIKYQRTSQNVKILDIHTGQFRHQLVVESEGKSLVLTTTGRRGKLFRFMALGERDLPKGPKGPQAIN